KRVQIGNYRGGGLAARCGVRDDGLLIGRLPQTQPLVGKEEEGPVLEDRAAEHTAKIVGAFGWFLQTVVIDKPVPRVKLIVPEIFGARAVKSISSGAGHDRDLAAGGAAELRSK